MLNFPVEIIKEILLYLPGKDILNCGITCKLINRIVDDDFWKTKMNIDKIDIKENCKSYKREYIESVEEYYSFWLGEDYDAELSVVKNSIKEPKHMIIRNFYKNMVEIFSIYEECYIPKDISEIHIRKTKDFYIYIDDEDNFNIKYMKKDFFFYNGKYMSRTGGITWIKPTKCISLSYGVSGGFNLVLSLLMAKESGIERKN